MFHAPHRRWGSHEAVRVRVWSCSRTGVVAALSPVLSVSQVAGEAHRSADREGEGVHRGGKAGELVTQMLNEADTFWKLREDPSWQPYCLNCSTMVRMAPCEGGFSCSACGLLVDRAMQRVTGSALRTWRLAAGLTLEDMGRRLECHSVYVGRIEGGTKRVTPRVFAAYREMVQQKLGEV